MATANKIIQRKNRELEIAYKEVEKLSKTDELTQLSNRRDMIEKVTAEINRFKRNKKEFVFILVDIDDFKKINDTHGHDMGDYVLEELAKIMRQVSREIDVLARWGGEEFLIMLPETNLDGGIKFCEKLKNSILENIFHFNNREISITITQGITVFNGEYDSIDPYIKFADDALYKGKNCGKNTIITKLPEKVNERS